VTDGSEQDGVTASLHNKPAPSPYVEDFMIT